MTRRSLRPHLNQIRSWVRQGRTDAWIAHQLEVTVQQIQAFKREQELEPDGDNGAVAEVDLRAEDDEAIAAELEAEEDGATDEEAPKPTRRRARRPRRRKAGTPLEGTFDHGEEGYGLWLDPAVQDDPVYAEHWAGHRPIEVVVEEDQIVIRRAGGDDDES
jgi:hypothetical protein